MGGREGGLISARTVTFLQVVCLSTYHVLYLSTFQSPCLPLCGLFAYVTAGRPAGR